MKTDIIIKFPPQNDIMLLNNIQYFVVINLLMIC